MAGVMTREEPLIKQLVRSRALRPRDHSSSPTRGRSPIQKFTITSNKNNHIKSAYAPPIRSISQPPPINQRQGCTITNFDASQNASRPHLYAPIMARRVSANPHQLQYFSTNSFDGHIPQSINLSHVAYNTSIASKSQSMSVSQPNLEIYKIHNQIEGPQFAYYSPVNYSTRCSSVSTLPPSSSRCGSPIQPTLLSPLNVSKSTTPLGSHQNLSA